MTDARGVRRSRSDEEEESYFVSMADMMVGLLFIFLILLLYFALQFRQTTTTLTGAAEARTELLKTLKRDLKKRGLVVSIDTRTGVMRLPEEIRFESNQFELNAPGRRAASVIADELARVLPCYTVAVPGGLRCPPGRKRSAQRIDSVFVEGHTDKNVLIGGGPVESNFDLSALRATRTFKALMEARSDLRGLVSLNDGARVPIFGVSGYGESRPSSTDDNRNRRIDLRFLMVTPQGAEDATLSSALVER